MISIKNLRQVRYFCTNKEVSSKYLDVVITGTKSNITLIRLNRRREMNSINTSLLQCLNHELKKADADSKIRSIIITGTNKYFSIGADIGEMSRMSPVELENSGFIESFNEISTIRKPIIAAVNGYTFGGGLELAMACDIIYAGENAIFSQPEINIGIIPGAGGTQRLPRIIGKSRAMEYILTGDRFTAGEALHFGLVSKVFKTSQLLEKSVELAENISNVPEELTHSIKKTILSVTTNAP